MDLWKKAIQTGNQAFASGHFTKARLHYRQACDHALWWLERCDDYRDGLAALGVSYQNLADTYLHRHEQEQWASSHVQLYQHLLHYSHCPARHPAERLEAESLWRRVATEFYQVLAELKVKPSDSPARLPGTEQFHFPFSPTS